MPHHFSQRNNSSDARASIQASVARSVLVWNVIGHPDDHAFPNQLEPGDFSLTEPGDIYLYTGRRWHLLVSSVPEGDEKEVRGLTTIPDPARLRVTFDND